jgi:beta-ribofuranosylaminobenzene 5'-phosphate synthase
MNSYTVRAGARIACCLLDMNGERGRADGTLGISLESPTVEVVAKASDVLELDVDDAMVPAARAGIAIGEAIAGAPLSVRVQIPRWILPHVGLGHKTQTVLAVALASLRASSVWSSGEDLVKASGRGGTSGAGVHAFLGGGIVLDGGHRFGAGGKVDFLPSSVATHTGPPPLIARVHAPLDLRVVIATPMGFEGASGAAEVAHFRRAFPVPRADADSLIANVYMRLVPALIEGDMEQISAGVDAIQGSTFKRSIWMAQPKQVRRVRDVLRATGIAVGISSMGSTIYSITDCDESSSVADAYRDTFNSLRIDANIEITRMARAGATVHVDS